MSDEMKRIKKELEATRAALKSQASRCRQLVAAFARKLQEKETELRSSCELRDQQLNCVLRSLLILEGRLRREQKLIRHQLAEKDEVIARQNRELADLKRIDLQFETIEDSTGSDAPNFENAYKDNPVLESVNQILLKDEEDLLTEVKSVKSEKNGKLEGGVEWYETDSSLIVPDDHQSSGAWCIKVIEEGDDPSSTHGHDRLWVRERTSPPTKAQHSEEKTCLQMSKKTLTIAIHKDLEEVDANSCALSECSYQELAPVNTKPIYQKLPSPQKPPALPPKPSRLLKPSELLQQRNEACQSVSVKPDPHPKPRVHAQEMKRKQMNGHVPGNIKPQAPFLVQCNDRVQPSAPARINSFPEKKENSDFPKSTAGSATRARHDVPEAPIRMGTSVSSLITGATRDSIVTELKTPDASVTQLVRQFETRNQLPAEDSLHENFEEFKLEESYVESVSEGDGRPEADGAESRCGVSHYAVLTSLPVAPLAPPPPIPSVDSTRTYETFLESTGLSQKSILTPSRMLSNHRSCLKPKDVKHRSRVKAAAIDKCLGPSLGPTVKYWTEPYL